jgi:hypothetical protein
VKPRQLLEFVPSSLYKRPTNGQLLNNSQ